MAAQLLEDFSADSFLKPWMQQVGWSRRNYDDEHAVPDSKLYISGYVAYLLIAAKVVISCFAWLFYLICFD